MKLWELKRDTYFVIEQDPIYDGINNKGIRSTEIFLLDHIDGAFSVCYTMKKELVHLSASTPVREYEIKMA
jgi:hypothetical protein